MQYKNEAAADAGTSRGGGLGLASSKHRSGIYRTQDQNTSISRRLAALAHRADRLSPDRMNPERFYVEREEVVRELLNLARETGR